MFSLYPPLSSIQVWLVGLTSLVNWSMECDTFLHWSKSAMKLHNALAAAGVFVSFYTHTKQNKTSSLLK